MIFTFTDIDKGLDKIFHDNTVDIYNWISQIPSPDLNMIGDPALLNEIYGKAGQDFINEGLSYISSLYLYNTVTATRASIGKIASTVGFLYSDFNTISDIFREPSDSIYLEIALKTLDAVINSEYFQRGMDAIGAIPVIGWIIKIIVKVGESVYKIVKKINEKKASLAAKELAEQFSIPLVSFNEELDEALTKYAMSKIAGYDMNYLFSPRYLFENISDFKVVREKLKDSDEVTRYFNIRSDKILGLGFIPGTVNLTGAMRFPTGGCAEIYDTGEFYPTVKNLANSIYQIVQKPGPAMFAINCEYISSLWETVIHNMLVYGEESIKKGWTCWETAYPNTDEYLCSSDILKSYGKPDCYYPGQVNKKFKVKGNGHYGAYRNYISKKFFNDKMGLYIKNNEVDVSKSVPVSTLNVLASRQLSTLDSLKCMYINDQKKMGRYIFNSFENNKELKSRWESNVKKILNSSDWKRLVFYDIPDGPIKNVVYEKAKKAGLDPDKQGIIDKSINLNIKIPSVLGDPVPPPPVNPIDTSNKLSLSDITNGKKSKVSNTSSGILPLVALGGIGYMLMNR